MRNIVSNPNTGHFVSWEMELIEEQTEAVSDAIDLHPFTHVETFEWEDSDDPEQDLRLYDKAVAKARALEAEQRSLDLMDPALRPGPWWE